MTSLQLLRQLFHFLVILTTLLTLRGVRWALGSNKYGLLHIYETVYSSSDLSYNLTFIHFWIAALRRNNLKVLAEVFCSIRLKGAKHIIGAISIVTPLKPWKKVFETPPKSNQNDHDSHLYQNFFGEINIFLNKLLF